MKTFKRYFLAHGVLGTKSEDAVDIPNEALLDIVPLVFWLLPAASLNLTGRPTRIKPIIEKHLQNLGVQPEELLVDILKEIADQYAECSAPASVTRRRKHGIADIRATPALYKSIWQRQGGRCAVCGARFDSTAPETLDHIIPYKLVGDIADGSNYQFLCGVCNRGKSSWLSAYQSRFALNWVYDAQRSSFADLPEEARYLALIRDGRCTEPGCTATPRHASLSAVRVICTGLYLVDNVTTRCTHHRLHEN